MSGSLSGLSAGTLYAMYSKNEQSYVTKFEGYDPATKSAIAYFNAQAPKLTSAEALLKDYKSLQVVLGAFGMSSMIGDTAMLRDLMTQNPNSSSSLAQQLANPSYQRFAKYMSQWTPPPLSSSSTVNVIINQYATNSFEASQDAQAPGIQAALYFKRTVSSVTSLAQLMGDATLTNVARVVSGLPESFGALDYDQQVRILSKTVDVSKFKQPGYVDQYVQQFMALNQENPPTTQAPATLLSLLGGSDSSGADPILSLFGSSSSGSLLSLFA